MYLTIREAQEQLPDLSQHLEQEPAIITQDGKPVMVALSIEQFEALFETWEILSDKEFWPTLQTGIHQAELGDVVSIESIKAELGID